jgi:hypothetical protein
MFSGVTAAEHVALQQSATPRLCQMAQVMGARTPPVEAPWLFIVTLELPETAPLIRCIDKTKSSVRAGRNDDGWA